jgi:peptide/nickel transport system ATP-binding protein
MSSRPARRSVQVEEVREASLLEIRDLRTEIRLRRSTVEAVSGISMAINLGETVGLVGESGCGKSMTGLSIMRLLPPGGRIAAGSIKLSGREITRLPEAEMRRIRGDEIAMVFQDPMTSLNPTMPIGRQIAEAVRTHKGCSWKEATDRAAEVLDLVGMPRPSERLGVFPHQLSGGLRQRVMLAIALSCEPKLLIADEPTTALDVTIQSQILRLLDELKERLEMGMLLITHDLGVIAGRADRVMVMYAGQIVECADTTTIFTGKRHPYSQALLESIPRLDGDDRRVLYSIPGSPPDLAHPSPACRFAPRCRYAQKRCHDEQPRLSSAAGHAFACFFPVEAADTKDASGLPGVISARTSPHGADDRTAGGAGSVEAAPLLVLEHVVKEYPVTKGLLQRNVGSVKAVSGVSFDVAQGETLGLVGESGCGKSTLARLIVALEKPTSGSIHFASSEMSALKGGDLRRIRRHLQLIFQDPYASLDPRMRISLTLREPLEAQHIGTRRQQDRRIRELLDEVGLSSRSLELYPHEFSGGQRQRIGIARALSLGPRLIVADEPVSALDVSIQSQVLNLLKRIQSQRDLTYIIISHDLSVVRYLADRVAVMYLGKLVEIGPASEVYSRPAHPYTAGLLDSVPIPDPRAERAKHTLTVRGELPSASDPPSGCRFRTRCPRAQDICAEIEPALRQFGVPTHQAACHFPLQAPINRARPSSAAPPN